MSDKKQTPMTPKHASRIQSQAHKSGTNQGFKERAQGAGDKNANQRHARRRLPCGVNVLRIQPKNGRRPGYAISLSRRSSCP